MRNNGSEGDTAKLEIKEKLTSGIRLSCEMLTRRVRIGNLYTLIITLMDDAGRTGEERMARYRAARGQQPGESEGREGIDRQLERLQLRPHQALG